MGDILWHGPFLDAHLTIKSTSDPLVLDYAVISHDLKLGGSVILQEGLTPRESVEAVVDIVRAAYLAEVQRDKDQEIENGSFLN
jgi:hypothetical protein